MLKSVENRGVVSDSTIFIKNLLTKLDMDFLKSTLHTLKDYCLNSSLAGLSYIGDSR